MLMHCLWQLLEPFDAAEVADHICRALKHHEVNWKCLLSLTAVTLVTCHEAKQHVHSISTLFAFLLLFCAWTLNASAILMPVNSVDLL